MSFSCVEVKEMLDLKDIVHEEATRVRHCWNVSVQREENMMASSQI